MKSKNYFLTLLVTALVVYGIHFSLLHTRVINYSWYHFNLFDGIVFLIFLVGGLMIVPAFKQKAENFTLRFLVLTTAQMFSALSIVAALAYVKIPNARAIGFNLISVFLVFLTVQSVLLVKGLRDDS